MAHPLAIVSRVSRPTAEDGADDEGALVSLPHEVLLRVFDLLSLADLHALTASCRALDAILDGQQADQVWHGALCKQYGWLMPELCASAQASQRETAPSRRAVVRMEAQLRTRGRILLIGGSSLIANPAHITSIECTPVGVHDRLDLPDGIGAPRTPGSGDLRPGGGGCMAVRRQALAAARDCSGKVYAVGGWWPPAEGHELPGVAQQQQRPLAVSSCEVFDLNAGEPRWQPLRAEMGTVRAFPGAACLGGWDILAVGGGTGPWVGDDCHKSTELYHAAHCEWRAGPQMHSKRCGLAVVQNAQGSALHAIGGYGGGYEYHASMEALPIGNSGGRGWMPAPPMLEARSGHSASVGPDGRTYVVGGTNDGSTMATSTEAYDPRTGRWSSFAPLPAGRGFHAACFGLDGRLYVLGGDKTGAVDDLHGLPDGVHIEVLEAIETGQSSLVFD
mmetsp:Transcript_44414/g.110039  ORF Transcript_44414/g.110039 Transcript_44414/m.110039 type:complete len:447 (-) Transcript_44414:53-1393(-)